MPGCPAAATGGREERPVVVPDLGVSSGGPGCDWCSWWACLSIPGCNLSNLVNQTSHVRVGLVVDCKAGDVARIKGVFLLPNHTAITPAPVGILAARLDVGDLSGDGVTPNAFVSDLRSLGRFARR
jgi:hypothetical protein